MTALLLSFLFLYIDDRSINDIGAGDLATASLKTRFTSLFANKLGAIYNDLTNSFSPPFAMKILPFYLTPDELQCNSFLDQNFNTWSFNILEDFNISSDAVQYYNLLWYKYIKGDNNLVFYKDTPFKENISVPPCKDDKIIKTYKLERLCKLKKSFSDKPLALLGLLKYNLQSPIFLEQELEYNQLFENKNATLSKFGYSAMENEKQLKGRPNAFVAVCSFGYDLKDHVFEDCKLFSRSFTNMGIGYTANNQIARKLFKSKHFGMKSNFIFPNDQLFPKNMTTAGSDYALRVFVENNREEVDHYENTKSLINPVGTMSLMPIERKVTLHNPMEPANLRSNSFSIPLGYSTIVYITPKVRTIDVNAIDLTESERGCRLNNGANDLKIFNAYSKESCLLECKIEKAYNKCGCFPWNYPIIEGSTF